MSHVISKTHASYVRLRTDVAASERTHSRF